MKWLVRVAIVSLLLLAALLVVDWVRRWPPDPAPYEAAAQAYELEIFRDPYGVPHIHGRRDADVTFGLAYAHAEDDFSTIQDVVFAIRGVSAQHQGAEAAPSDFLVRWLEVWETVDAGYETRLSAKTRELLRGYADGLNLYAARHPDEVAFGFLPVRGQDIAAGFVLKTPLFYRLDRRLKELFEDERQRPLVDFEEGLMKSMGLDLGAQFGSNGFAVAPSRSGDGTTRLVVNSHQPLDGPVAWYEFRGRSDEGLDVAGGTFPGAPLMLHGHNRDLGWAATVNFPDLMDIYVLEVDEEDPARYRLDGEWKTMRSKPITLWVKLWGPIMWPARRTLWFSEHGPVLRRPHGTYAVRWVGRGARYSPRHPQQEGRGRTAEGMARGFADPARRVGAQWRAREPLRSSVRRQPPSGVASLHGSDAAVRG